MRLKSARISRFRSITDVTLSRCGAFNVVIGKNNAGKSNLLLALSAFFRCIRNGAPVSIDPPIGQSFDFHTNAGGEPIELYFSFMLAHSETKVIRDSIISTAPQMRNAAESLATDLTLAVSVTVPKAEEGEQPYAYAREIKLIETVDADASKEHLLFRVPEGAAAELAERAQTATNRADGAEVIRRFLESRPTYGAEMWETIRSDLGRYLAYSADAQVSPDVNARLNAVGQQADSYDEFVLGAEKLAVALETEAEAARTTPLRTNIETFTGNEDRVPPYVYKVLDMLSSLPVLYLTERREPIGPREASLLLNLKVSRGGSDQLREIQRTVSDLLGVEIDAFQVQSGRRRGNTAELDIDRFVVQVNGAGIREALRLVLDYELKQPALLLVEEPEIHLHPALETTVLRYLKSIGDRCQIFLTTHSTNFLDTAEMNNVYLASKNGSTQVEQIDMEAAESILPRELGLRLSSLFMFDRLVFVEGPTDEDVLREIAARHDVNFGKASVGFIALGGVRNFAHYANQATLAFLTKRQVSLWFILDRDERDDEEVKRLAELLGDRAQLAALEKREIENYLLNPRAIAAYISERRSIEQGGHGKGGDLTEEQIARDLRQFADDLYELTLRKRVTRKLFRPVYPDRKSVLEPAEGNFEDRLIEELSRAAGEFDERKGHVRERLEAEQEGLRARWENEKLSLVPGALLLDLVFQKYGIRFRKERDAIRLAGHLGPGDVDPSLVALLRKIGG